jgi:hypothetical protein
MTPSRLQNQTPTPAPRPPHRHAFLSAGRKTQEILATGKGEPDGQGVEVGTGGALRKIGGYP